MSKVFKRVAMHALMRNRLLAVILVAAMVSLSACGGSGQADGPSPAETTEHKTENAPAQEISSDDDERHDVLVDTDEFRVEYRGIDNNYGHDVWAIKLYIENRSDHEVNARVNNLMVNSCLISNTSGDVVKVPAGESMEDNSNLIDIENVQYYQEENLSSLQFDLDLFETENWQSVCSAKGEFEESLPVPTGEVKPSECDTVLYESDGILIKTAGIGSTSPDFKQLDVYMENNTEETVGVTFPNMKIMEKTSSALTLSYLCRLIANALQSRFMIT